MITLVIKDLDIWAKFQGSEFTLVRLIKKKRYFELFGTLAEMKSLTYLLGFMFCIRCKKIIQCCKTDCYLMGGFRLCLDLIRTHCNDKH